MLVLLQIWGGIFFLLNKVFLSAAERTEQKKFEPKGIWRKYPFLLKVHWRRQSWIVFLVGVPAWIIIFVIDHNWIAAALETGAIPSMLVGLIISFTGKGSAPKWLHFIAITSIVLGLGYSAYDFHGFNTFTQASEFLMTAGLQIGTYQIARKKLSGYLWFGLMHISCIALMYMQHHPWLLVQQVISIAFVYDAYRIKKKNS